MAAHAAVSFVSIFYMYGEINIKRLQHGHRNTVLTITKHEAESHDLTLIYEYIAASTQSLNDLILLILNVLYVRLINN